MKNWVMMVGNCLYVEYYLCDMFYKSEYKIYVNFSCKNGNN